MKKKILFLILLVVSLFTINVKAEELNGLVTENNKTYYYIDGIKQKGFQKIDNKTYFFSRINDNAMRTGTFQIDGSYYHFNDDGTMFTGILEENGKKYFYGTDGKKGKGFQKYDGKTYFFSRVGDNAMRTGKFQIDGPQYYFLNDGTMFTGILEENGKKYFYGTDGKKGKGFQKYDGKTYFFSRVGDNAMRTGKFAIDGKYYYFKNDGVMHTGILEENGKTYYYSNDGVMQKGIVQIEDKKYYFNNDGVKAWGLQKYNGKTYFFSRIDDHSMRTGFFQIDGYYYFFKDNGEMVMGFASPENIKRFFSRVDGKMRTGWVYIDGYMYYFDPTTGEMTVGTKTIDDVNYTFDSNGRIKSGFVTDSSGNVRYYFQDGSFANDWVTVEGKKYFFNSLGVMIASNAKKVIDVSYYNKTIDWATAKNKGGVDAAIIRVAYRGYGTGKLVNDDNYQTNITGAQSVGLPIGLYVYSQAINVEEAVEEANRAIQIANANGGKSKITLPIVIDTEYTDAWENGVRAGRADSLSKEARTNIVKAFVDRVRAAGYEPMIYASKSFLENNLDMSKLANNKLWVAQYNHYCTYTGPGNKIMWQYSSKESVKGITGNVDVSVMY